MSLIEDAARRIDPVDWDQKLPLAKDIITLVLRRQIAVLGNTDLYQNVRNVFAAIDFVERFGKELDIDVWEDLE